eukprot:1176047-Prorocentrum_minimum.AAC.9
MVCGSRMQANGGKRVEVEGAWASGSRRERFAEFWYLTWYEVGTRRLFWLSRAGCRDGGTEGLGGCAHLMGAAGSIGNL